MILPWTYGVSRYYLYRVHISLRTSCIKVPELSKRRQMASTSYAYRVYRVKLAALPVCVLRYNHISIFSIHQHLKYHLDVRFVLILSRFK